MAAGIQMGLLPTEPPAVEEPREAPKLPPVAEDSADDDNGPWAGRDFAWG